MTSVVVRPARKPLVGSVPLPSDKSIGHRAVIFAALSAGDCELRRFSGGEDNVATVNAFRSLGVEIEQVGENVLRCSGVGLDGLRGSLGALDCGNSGTTMRLLCGVLAGQHFESTLVGDASLSKRPMLRVAKPLRSRGGVLEGEPHPTRSGDITAPLRVGALAEGERLAPLDYESPIASAQVKSALLFSGLFASGPTSVQEPVVSRDHTERMMSALSMPIESAGPIVRLHPPADPKAIRRFDVDLPGDLSAAAFLLVAAQLVEGSAVTTRATGLNPTRAGILEAIRHFGGQTDIQPQGDALGEPFGEVTGRHAELAGATIAGELVVRAIDEIPIACALGARARGQSAFLDIGELRVKESDRVATMASVLRSFGVEVEEHEAALVVEGRPDRPLTACRIDAAHDHRIAMTAAVLGLVADGETTITGADVIATSFPRFVGTLRALGAEIEVRS